jgi:hypothetical protein
LEFLDRRAAAKLKYRFNGVPRETELELKCRFNLRHRQHIGRYSLVALRRGIRTQFGPAALCGRLIISEMAIKHAFTKSTLAYNPTEKTMKRAGSKVPVEQQQDEQPDDLSIPDFLRRPIPTSAAKRVENRQQSAPAPSVN